MYLFLILQHHGIVSMLFSVCCLHPRVVSCWRRWEAPHLLGFLCYWSFWHVIKYSNIWGLCSTLFSTGSPANIQQCHPNTQNLPSALFVWISSISFNSPASERLVRFADSVEVEGGREDEELGDILWVYRTVYNILSDVTARKLSGCYCLVIYRLQMASLLLKYC